MIANDLETDPIFGTATENPMSANELPIDPVFGKLAGTVSATRGLWFAFGFTTGCFVAIALHILLTWIL